MRKHPRGIDREDQPAAMLTIMRSRPSQVLVALLCAIVLSRMPAPIFAEDAISVATIEGSMAVAVLTTHAISDAARPGTVATSVIVLARADSPHPPLLDFAVLRL